MDIACQCKTNIDIAFFFNFFFLWHELSFKFITIRKKEIHNNNNNNNNNKGLYTKEKNIRFEINNIVIIRDDKFVTLICG